MTRILLSAVALISIGLATAACEGGRSDYAYSQRRGVNSDIAVTHQIGPTSLYPGHNFTDYSEPKGTYPWRVDEHH